jgi:hypothetical protein
MLNFDPSLSAQVETVSVQVKGINVCVYCMKGERVAMHIARRSSFFVVACFARFAHRSFARGRDYR